MLSGLVFSSILLMNLWIDKCKNNHHIECIIMNTILLFWYLKGNIIQYNLSTQTAVLVFSVASTASSQGTCVRGSCSRSEQNHTFWRFNCFAVNIYDLRTPRRTSFSQNKWFKQILNAKLIGFVPNCYSLVKGPLTFQ